MKSNTIKTILIAIVAAALGLAGGYVLFNKNIQSKGSEHQHVETKSVSSEEIWTCSMHPQIRQPEFGDCAICGMDLIPLEANNSNDPLVLEMTESAAKLANIQTTIVGEQSAGEGKTIPLTGKVQADERLASSLVAHVAGRIEKLHISFTGEQVRVGQKIATIYAADLITAQRELLEALNLVELNPALLEAARNKLRYWKISQARIDAIEQSGKIQETFDLHAEAAGIVTNRRVAVGDYLKKGEPLFDLMNLQKLWIVFDAYEEDLAHFSVGDRIEFKTPALPNKTFKTRISFIDPVINSATRVAAIRTEFSNTRGLLKPEMLVAGSLQKQANKKTQLSIPKSAVLWTGKRSVVYVKVPDTNIPSFQFREVSLGDNLGDRYQILEGLALGEEVVTYGSFTIDAAAQLNNQTSMMNKDVKLKKEKRLAIPNYQASTPDDFKKQLTVLVKEYLQLKDAFVATDAMLASKAAVVFVKQLDQVDQTLVKGDAHKYWMEQLAILQIHGQKTSETEDVEEQREQFEFLSNALIASIEAFGLLDQVLYVQHCPMAFDNEGADWLATEEQIQNPYFGDKMMRCGIVKKTYEKNQ